MAQQPETGQHTHSIEKKRARNGKKLTEKKTKIWKKENGSGWTRTRHYQWIITQPNRFQSWMTRNFFIFEKTCNCIQCTHTHTWYVCCFTIRPPPRAHQCWIFQHLSMWFIHAFHDTTRFRAHETNCVLCTVHPKPQNVSRIDEMQNSISNSIGKRTRVELLSSIVGKKASHKKKIKNLWTILHVRCCV